MSNDDLAEDDCIGIEEQAANLILELWAEVERQARHIEELREKIDAEKSCACSFDAPGDTCAAHSPALTRALAEVERLTRERDEARAEIEKLRAENDEKQALIDAARAHRNNLRAEIERTHALLKDPNAVAINMLRGVIALPSADQIRHIYQQTPEAQP